MIALLLLLGCSDGATDSAAPKGAAPPALVINELLPRNRTTNTDGSARFEDWIELYNASDAPIDLSAFHLNEYPASTSLQAPLPAIELAPRDWLIVWCDGAVDTATAERDVHVAFKLDGGDGESLSLVWLPAPEVDPILVETWTYGLLPADVSAARFPDGGPNWLQATPTPGETNGEAP